jgi:hypothetical protein
MISVRNVDKKAEQFLTLPSIIVSKSNEDVLFILFSSYLERELFFHGYLLWGLAFDKLFNDFLGIGIPSFSGECNSGRAPSQLPSSLIWALQDVVMSSRVFSVIQTPLIP